jgi:hypothetical protein
VVPDRLDGEADLFEAGEASSVFVLVAESSVVRLAEHLDHQRARLGEEVDPAEPRLPAEIDLPAERPDPVPLGQRLEAALEVARRRHVPPWPCLQDLAHHHRAGPTAVGPVAEHPVQVLAARQVAGPQGVAGACCSFRMHRRRQLEDRPRRCRDRDVVEDGDVVGVQVADLVDARQGVGPSGAAPRAGDIDPAQTQQPEPRRLPEPCRRAVGQERLRPGVEHGSMHVLLEGALRATSDEHP